MVALYAQRPDVEKTSQGFDTAPRLQSAYCMQVQEQGDQKMVSPSSDRGDIKNIEAGNLSNENAERRANTPVNEQPFTSIQAFDGVGECLKAILLCVGDDSRPYTSINACTVPHCLHCIPYVQWHQTLQCL